VTWAKFDDRFTENPDLLALPRGVRLLYIESIVWSCKLLQDGVIPAHVLTRISDEPNVEQAAQQLVDARFWTRTETGYVIGDFLEHQPSRAEVEKRRADTAARQERSRRHRNGDHSMCTQGTYCPQGAVTRDTTRSSPRDSQRQSQRQSQRPVPTRPDPTPREGREEGTEAAPPAPSGSQERAPSKPRGFTVVMPQHEDSR
jgi:hypothetical protein